MKEIFIVLKDYLVFINIIFACVVIFFERRRPVFTLFWITILLLTSYFGFIMYLFFGMRFKRRRALEKYYLKNQKEVARGLNSKEKKELEKWKNLIYYLDSVLVGEMTDNNNFEIYENNEKFFENIKKSLLEAKNTIYMEYYIFDDDIVGAPIYDILEKKAEEGVKVKIIVDGAGTRGVKKERIERLRKKGAEFEIFFPSYFPFIKIGNLRANYRDHRKITVIDKKICYSGGLNIGKDYIGKGKLGNWRDVGFCIQGDAILDYLHEFERNWNFVKKNKKKLVENEIIKVDKYEKNFIQVVSSGPNYEFHTIRDSFLELILKAEKTIDIQTPYFVPDEMVLDALKRALLSGIKIRIVIPSIGDHAFVYWANQYFYGELIELGAEIYKYRDGFIHSKIVLIDNEVSFLGTANFDYRSMYQNFEISILIFGEKIKDIQKRVEIDIKNSNRVSLDLYRNRGKIQRVKESISKLLAPIL